MNGGDDPDGPEAGLLRRMQSADPARTSHPTDSWMPDLEAAMSVNPEDPLSRPRLWVTATAAAATFAVLGGGAYAYLVGRDPASTPDSVGTVLALPADSGTSMGSCAPFDVEPLRDVPLAFAGSATEVGAESVTLDVDHWYKGGNADVVRLTNYDLSTVSLDGLTFEPGDRYLITATGGTVNLCGFSGPWNRELADAFAEAFSS